MSLKDEAAGLAFTQVHHELPHHPYPVSLVMSREATLTVALLARMSIKKGRSRDLAA